MLSLNVMKTDFPVQYSAVLGRLDSFNPRQYAADRNYINGGVSRLSPYISRGMLSTRFIHERITAEHGFDESHRFIYELAWREFFQRVWRNLGDDIFNDIKREQAPVSGPGVPEAIVRARTGIRVLDHSIRELYDTGYMHNHVRMWIASVVCNTARRHWRAGAGWMYYHLFDGDPASNTLGWQWVAGTFSHREYLANQENINKYAGESGRSDQHGTFLDHAYEDLPGLRIPGELRTAISPELASELPETPAPTIAPGLPVHLYHCFALDPTWRSEQTATRVLVLDPDWFARFPVSSRVLDWILRLAENIPGLQVFSGDPSALDLSPATSIHFRRHPCATRFPGTGEEPDRLVPEIPDEETGLTFTPFWKRCEKILRGEAGR